MKSRIFNFSSKCVNPETGESYLTEDTIKVALAHKSIKRWAYIKHDHDVITAYDVANDQTGKLTESDIGKPKDAHWHVVFEMKSNSIDTSVVARWFDLPENMIAVAKGRGAFLDCVQYLTHERKNQQELGKRLYSDDEVMASPGFDFRDELTQREERKLKYGADLDTRGRIRYEVMYNGMTLRQAREENRLNYIEDCDTLKRLRMRYMTEIATPPKMRINIYVEGSGGIGKGLISRALARVLMEAPSDRPDDEIYFQVGTDRTLFEGYDGQPVIIWNDARAVDLIKMLGGRGNVFNIFDQYPQAIAQNIKYSSVTLQNTVNIVNGIEPWQDFLDGLAGEYTTAGGVKHEAEDRSQSYRRFPFFLIVHEDDYDLGMNKGVFDGTREFEQYEMYQGLRGSMRSIAEKYGNDQQALDQKNREVLAVPKEKYDELKAKLENGEELTEEEDDILFGHLGELTGGVVTVDAAKLREQKEKEEQEEELKSEEPKSLHQKCEDYAKDQEKRKNEQAELDVDGFMKLADEDAEKLPFD